MTQMKSALLSIFFSALTHTHTLNSLWDFLVWKLSDQLLVCLFCMVSDHV